MCIYIFFISNNSQLQYWFDKHIMFRDEMGKHALIYI